jgi:hypothetical protein
MDRVGPREIHRILAVTDSLHLHRESISVPLATRGEGNVRLLGERIEIVAPADGDFDSWLQSLPGQIQALELTRVRRSE